MYIDFIYIYIYIYVYTHLKKYILVIKKKYGQVSLQVSMPHVHIYTQLELLYEGDPIHLG